MSGGFPSSPKTRPSTISPLDLCVELAEHSGLETALALADPVQFGRLRPASSNESVVLSQRAKHSSKPRIRLALLVTGGLACAFIVAIASSTKVAGSAFCAARPASDITASVSSASIAPRSSSTSSDIFSFSDSRFAPAMLGAARNLRKWLGWRATAELPSGRFLQLAGGRVADPKTLGETGRSDAARLFSREISA